MKLIIILMFLVNSCKNPPETVVISDCQKISIKNRWNDLNHGIPYLKVEKPTDFEFICNKVKNFPPGKNVMVRSLTKKPEIITTLLDIMTLN